MNIFKNLIIAVFILNNIVFTQDVLRRQPNSVYICTFNVYKMGAVAPKYLSYDDEDEGEPTTDWGTPQRIKKLASILAVGSFDLVILQELRSGGQGEWALSDLAKELKDEHDIEYEHFMSDHIGRGLIPEAMGFLYKETSLTPRILSGQNKYTENIEISGRDLVRTEWISGNFDFTLISCHLAWGNEAHRDEGYKKVQEILTTTVPSEYSNDPDIIILGDFNRFGNGYDSIKELEFDSSKYLVPNITFFDPKVTEKKTVTKNSIRGKGVPGDNPQLISTTVAKNRYVYDIIFMTKDCDEEFPGDQRESIYENHFGIIHFDEKDGFGYQSGAEKLSHNKLKVAYSDHRPLWVRFINNSDNKDNVEISEMYLGTEGGSKFHLAGCRTIRGRETSKKWENREDALSERGPCGVCKP